MPPSDQTVLSPDTVSFKCSSAGRPRADIYWISKDNIVISNTTEKFVISTYAIGNCNISDPCMSSSTLQILNTRAVDSGEYTCVATNIVGNYSSTTILIVNGKHSICIIYCSVQ